MINPSGKIKNALLFSKKEIKESGFEGAGIQRKEVNTLEPVIKNLVTMREESDQEVLIFNNVIIDTDLVFNEEEKINVDNHTIVFFNCEIRHAQISNLQQFTTDIDEEKRDKINLPKLYFVKCWFENFFVSRVSGVELNFFECKFLDDLTFNEIKLSTISADGCIFKRFYLSGNNYKSYLNLSGCKINEITAYRSKIEDLFFSKCTIKKRMNISFSEIDSISAEVSSFLNVSLTCLKCNSYKIWGTTISKEIVFRVVRIADFEIYSSKISSLLVEHSTIFKAVYLETNVDKLLISTSKFLDKITLSKSTFGEAIFDLTLITNFKYGYQTAGNLEIKSSIICFLSFNDTTIQLNNRVILSKSDISYLLFNKFTVDGNLSVFGLEKIWQHDFINLIVHKKIRGNPSKDDFGAESFYKSSDDYNNTEEYYGDVMRYIEEFYKSETGNIEALYDNTFIDELDSKLPDLDSFIVMKDSNFKETNFVNCELGKFRKYFFEDSILVQVNLVGGSLPESIKIPLFLHKNINVSRYKARSEQYLFEQNILFFSQLIIALSKSGDNTRAYLLKSQSNKHLRKLNWLNKNLVDYVPLFLSYLSSNHGKSWLRALMFLITGSLIFYLLILSSMGRVIVGAQIDLFLVGQYFNFLNPLRGFNFFNEIGLKPNSLTYFFDLIGRVFIGYGVYQLIGAFRKYGRK